MELYTVLGEYDNTGFPLSYCLLSTASSIDDGKWLKALEAWAVDLRQKHGIIPKFVHTAKDMAEIGMSQRVWSEAKHQLCWWHIREVLKKRLKGNLPTTPYNATRAKREYHFVDLKFKPHGQADPKDSEGSVPDEAHESYAAVNEANEPELTNKDPNSICIRIPIIPAPTHHDKPKQTPKLNNLLLSQFGFPLLLLSALI